MKLLIDNDLSSVLAEALREGDYDVVHVREIGLRDAPDGLIVARAVAENRVIVSRDNDFGTLPTLGAHGRTSLVLLRGGFQGTWEDQREALLELLPALEDELEQGCIAVFHRGRIRVHPLRER